MVVGGFLVLAALSTPCTPASRPLLAEVYYDAIGDDSGREFVELLNTGASSHALAGLRLEAGDGSGPGRWTLRWTGGAGDTIRPGARFVIGGAAVTPPPDAIASLDLQNGPDAVRLVWPDGWAEVLGYGAHEFAEYACGDPAPDGPSGQSLARTPDDSNAGGNALDFRPAAPSPGAANVSTRNVAIARGTLRVTPVSPAPGEPITITGGVMNPGREAVEPGIVLAAETVRDPGARERFAEVTLAAGLAAGDSAAFSIAASAPAAGKMWIVVTARTPGDQNASDDTDSMRVRVGPCRLALSEIQFHPTSGEGEWIEVRNVSEAGVEIPAFTISDHAGTVGRPESGGAALAPESLAVLVQDRRAFLARFPALDSARVSETRPWPSLNNRDDESGIADAVVLSEQDGTPCDRHQYSATGLPDGVTIEWRNGGWWPARTANGSPLERPRAFTAPAGRFVVEPRLLRAGARAARCRWMLPWPRARVRFEVLDLAGRRVPGGLAEFLAPALGERDVSFAELPPGLYVIALRARPEGGSEEISELSPLRIVGGAP